MSMLANIPGAMIILQVAWFVATLLFVAGLRLMYSPLRARLGLWLIGVGLVIALGAQVLQLGAIGANFKLFFGAVGVGVVVALWQAYRHEIANAPRMIALLNSLGGLAAASVAVLVLLQARQFSFDARLLAVFGVFFGGVAFSGSLYVWMRLGGLATRETRFVRFQVPYLASAGLLLVLGLLLSASATASPILLVLFVLCALAFGVLAAMPTAAADMPVMISMYNALTGIGVAFDGYLLNNPTMMVAGTLVFTAGTVLTRFLARALNRRLSEIMYSGFSASAHRDYVESEGERESFNHIDARDAAIDLAYAERVVVVPGYGMAVSHAHHKVRELTLLLEERGVDTAYAIHPVAGRMPGHMNILLAEAGVPYDSIYDLSDINSEFGQVDVVLVVGANDTINPGAREDTESPLYGMPILDVDKARRIIVLKRGEGRGYANVDNPLLQAAHTRLLSGDALASVQSMILHLKEIS